MNPEAPSSGTDRWASVVYGRTYSADLWWRALPEGVDRAGPEAVAVMAAVGGGRGLNRSPRLVLARLRTGTLLGVACQARQLGTDMDSDGRRPLFCFVGWFAAGLPTATVPELAQLEAAGMLWARDEYERRMRGAWTAHPSKLRTAEVTRPEEPPWSPPGTGSYQAPAVAAEVARAILRPARGQVRVHPSAERAVVWRAVARYGLDITLVTGWASHKDAVLDGVTDICADDVSTEPPLLVPAPTRRVQPAAGSRPAEPVPPAGFSSPAGISSPVEPVSPAEPTPAEPEPEEWLPGRLMSRFVRPVVDVIKEDLGLGTPSPPPEDVLSDWEYVAADRTYYTEVGGFWSAWDGKQLWRHNGYAWVDWYSGGAETDDDDDQDHYDEAEPGDDAEPAAAGQPDPLSGERIDWFNKEFG